MTSPCSLNSSRVVTDLLEKRAAIYNSRPPLPMVQDIVSGGARIVTMPYNERWRSLRKVMHQILSSRQTKTFQPYQDIESKTLLWNFLNNPDEWHLHIGQFSNSVMMSATFGRRMSSHDPDTAEMFRTVELFFEMQAIGASIADVFPVLANLPKVLQWWRPKGEEVYKRTVR